MDRNVCRPAALAQTEYEIDPGVLQENIASMIMQVC